MNDQETMEFMYLLFCLGIVMAVYAPDILVISLPLVALVGAFYFVVGLMARVTSSFSSVGKSRRNDWLNGVLIFTVLILIFGQKNLVFKAVEAMLAGIFLLFSGVFSLFHL